MDVPQLLLTEWKCITRMKPLGLKEQVATVIHGNELQRNAIFLILDHATDIYLHAWKHQPGIEQSAMAYMEKVIFLLNELLDKTVMNCNSVASK